MDSDGLIVAAPIYSRTVPGKLKLVADRLSGPAADVAFAENYRRMLEAGRDPAGCVSLRRAGLPAARRRLHRRRRRAHQPVEVAGAAADAPDDVLGPHGGRRPAARRRRRDAAVGGARCVRAAGGRARRPQRRRAARPAVRGRGVPGRARPVPALPPVDRLGSGRRRRVRDLRRRRAPGRRGRGRGRALRRSRRPRAVGDRARREARALPRGAGDRGRPGSARGRDLCARVDLRAVRLPDHSAIRADAPSRSRSGVDHDRGPYDRHPAGAGSAADRPRDRQGRPDRRARRIRGRGRQRRTRVGIAHGPRRRRRDGARAVEGVDLRHPADPEHRASPADGDAAGADRRRVRGVLARRRTSPAPAGCRSSTTAIPPTPSSSAASAPRARPSARSSTSRGSTAGC